MRHIVNMTAEQRQFIVALLSETKDDFDRAFRDLAKSDSIKGKRKFASDWISLAELAFTKAEDEEDEKESSGGFPDIVVDVQKEYNKRFKGLLPPCSRLTEHMRSQVKLCFELFGSDTMLDVFNQVSSDNVLLGNNHFGFIADFNFIFTPMNYARILRNFREKKGGAA